MGSIMSFLSTRFYGHSAFYPNSDGNITSTEDMDEFVMSYADLVEWFSRLPNSEDKSAIWRILTSPNYITKFVSLIGDLYVLWLSTIVTTHSDLPKPQWWSGWSDQLAQSYYEEQRDKLMNVAFNPQAKDLDRLWMMYYATADLTNQAHDYSARIEALGDTASRPEVQMAAQWSYDSHKNENRLALEVPQSILDDVQQILKQSTIDKEV